MNNLSPTESLYEKVKCYPSAYLWGRTGFVAPLVFSFVGVLGAWFVGIQHWQDLWSRFYGGLEYMPGVEKPNLMYGDSGIIEAMRWSVESMIIVGTPFVLMSWIWSWYRYRREQKMIEAWEKDKTFIPGHVKFVTSHKHWFELLDAIPDLVWRQEAEAVLKRILGEQDGKLYFFQDHQLMNIVKAKFHVTSESVVKKVWTVSPR